MTEIFSSQGGVIDAPVLLAKIADNIMDFNQEWEGD